jgi:energy-coupling factor transporter ATP-binding protein EcfA2
VAEWPLPEPTVRQDTAAGDTVLQVMAKLNETESEDDENVI